MLFLRLIKQAHITPRAASTKLHRLAGADSQVGSLAFKLKGNAVMRNAVVRQMKKPIEKRAARPMREPIDMFSLKIIGMGRRNIARSVSILRMAFDHLTNVVSTRAGLSWNNSPMQREVDTSAFQSSIVYTRYWRTLEDANEDERDGPAD
jgi:hypothetical protein